MNFKYLLKTTILSALFILVSGIYNVYNIFYSNYFDQLTYEVQTWEGRSTPPTEKEILLLGFKNIDTIIGSILISTLVLELQKRLKVEKNPKRKNSFRR